jgi:hypothetical protein
MSWPANTEAKLNLQTSLGHASAATLAKVQISAVLIQIHLLK